MKIIIAPDSFKGSMTAIEAAKAIEKGIKKVVGDAVTVLVPVADGGEGTMDSLVTVTGGKKVEVSVKGPLLDPVQAAYGILGDGKTCVIEMASASGIELINHEKLNPLNATTFGTGELIRRALDDGYRKFILAIGGSATNDAGVGMLQALGLKAIDSEGNEIGFGAKHISMVRDIDESGFDSRIKECEFIIASDVDNPLVGTNGASYVFGPQKGATADMVKILDDSLSHWADIVEAKKGFRMHDRPGAGAAGGIGGAFQAFFPSITKRGIDIVIEYTRLDEKMEGADCVFTGEGKIDSQTASGKTPMGVAQEAMKNGIPVFALAGSIGSGIEGLNECGITSLQSIVNAPMTLDEAINRGPELLANAAEQVMRIFFAANQRTQR